METETIHCEKGEWRLALRTVKTFGLTERQITDASLEAIRWADEMLATR